MFHIYLRSSVSIKFVNNVTTLSSLLPSGTKRTRAWLFLTLFLAPCLEIVIVPRAAPPLLPTGIINYREAARFQRLAPPLTAIIRTIKIEGIYQFEN